MNRVLWKMPVPSSALTRGPSFVVLMKRQCELSFWIEDEAGEKKIGVVFDEVEAFKCTYMTARSVEMINTAYDKLVQIEGSQWLAEVKANCADYYAKRQATRKDLEHLMICFDDGPCYEIVCGGFREERGLKNGASPVLSI